MSIFGHRSGRIPWYGKPGIAPNDPVLVTARFTPPRKLRVRCDEKSEGSFAGNIQPAPLSLNHLADRVLLFADGVRDLLGRDVHEVEGKDLSVRERRLRVEKNFDGARSKETDLGRHLQQRARGLEFHFRSSSRTNAKKETAIVDRLSSLRTPPDPVPERR